MTEANIKFVQVFLLAFLFSTVIFINAGDTSVDVAVESIYQSKQQFNKEKYARTHTNSVYRHASCGMTVKN